MDKKELHELRNLQQSLFYEVSYDFKWVAQDEHGHWRGYTKEPFINLNTGSMPRGWDRNGGKEKLIATTKVYKWKESCVTRQEVKDYLEHGSILRLEITRGVTNDYSKWDVTVRDMESDIRVSCSTRPTDLGCMTQAFMTLMTALEKDGIFIERERALPKDWLPAIGDKCRFNVNGEGDTIGKMINVVGGEIFLLMDDGNVFHDDMNKVLCWPVEDMSYMDEATHQKNLILDAISSFTTATNAQVDYLYDKGVRIYG